MPVNLWCWIVWILTHRAAKTVRRGVRKKGRRRKVVGKWATQGENAQEQNDHYTNWCMSRSYKSHLYVTITHNTYYILIRPMLFLAVWWWWHESRQWKSGKTVLQCQYNIKLDFPANNVFWLQQKATSVWVQMLLYYVHIIKYSIVVGITTVQLVPIMKDQYPPTTGPSQVPASTVKAYMQQFRDRKLISSFTYYTLSMQHHNWMFSYQFNAVKSKIRFNICWNALIVLF